jgi:hypothetical protein
MLYLFCDIVDRSEVGISHFGVTARGHMKPLNDHCTKRHFSAKHRDDVAGVKTVWNFNTFSFNACHWRGRFEMRIQNISSFANVIGRFVVDANSMLRFKLSLSCWHLKSYAGRVQRGSLRNDRSYGNEVSIGNTSATVSAHSLAPAYPAALLPALVTTFGSMASGVERATRLSLLDRLTSTAPLQQRHR